MPRFTPPREEFAGYLFDCDGTLADSMPLHFAAWLDSCAHFGVRFPISETEFYALGGIPTRTLAADLLRRAGAALDASEFAEFKESRYFARLADAKPIPEVVAFASDRARTHPVAVVTGATRPVVERTLERIGLAGFFQTLVSAERVPRGKPFPDGFLLAAELLGVPAERCLVVEDSEAGREAALAAGMQCILVGPPQPRERAE
jgi:HAD superfamily hydrolase (TIGR01509 family)